MAKRQNALDDKRFTVAPQHKDRGIPEGETVIAKWSSYLDNNEITMSLREYIELTQNQEIEGFTPAQIRQLQLTCDTLQKANLQLGTELKAYKECGTIEDINALYAKKDEQSDLNVEWYVKYKELKVNNTKLLEEYEALEKKYKTQLQVSADTATLSQTWKERYEAVVKSAPDLASYEKELREKYEEQHQENLDAWVRWHKNKYEKHIEELEAKLEQTDTQTLVEPFQKEIERLTNVVANLQGDCKEKQFLLEEIKEANKQLHNNIKDLREECDSLLKDNKELKVRLDGIKCEGMLGKGKELIRKTLIQDREAWETMFNHVVTTLILSKPSEDIKIVSERILQRLFFENQDPPKKT